MRNLLNRKINSVGYITEKSLVTYINILSWCLGIDSKPIHIIGTRIIHLWRTNGIDFTISYLKECVIHLYHYLGGQPDRVSHSMPIGLSDGIPKIIPGFTRLLIKEGNVNVIRGILTILSVYRIMNGTPKLKLGSITDPFKGHSRTLPSWRIRYELRTLIQMSGLTDIKLKPLSLHMSGSAGPNYKTALHGLYLDLAAWSANPLLLESLRSYALKHSNGKEWFDLFFGSVDWSKYINVSTTPILGRLHYKEEAAGKVRVFAIADIITQSVLKPLHEMIFSILKNIPMDGTFNQIRPIQLLQEKLKSGKLDGQTIYSFDLSSATDRLPVLLQRDIVSCLMGDSNFGQSWFNILTDRDWYLPLNHSKYSPEDPRKMVRYSVGQPMGALSSWAMLALTHHIIVLTAAQRVGENHFTDYALLGDDIVIANTAVAKAYHALITEELGVDISLPKSLVSSNSFEFAKQFLRGQENLSPLGPKNILLSIKSTSGILSLFIDMMNKGVVLNESLIDSLFKRSVPSVNRSRRDVLKWTILGPFGLVPSAAGLTSSMTLVNSLTAVRIDSLLTSIDDVLHLRSSESYWDIVVRTTRAITRLDYWKGPYLMFSQDIHWKIDSIQSFIFQFYLDKIEDLKSDPPVRRFIFDGPIIHFNHYRDGWMKEVMVYITNKLSKPCKYVDIIDSFDFSERVPLPFKSKTKGDDFFSIVRDLERQKDADRKSYFLR